MQLQTSHRLRVLNMGQIEQHHSSKAVDADRETLFHDLRDRINTIQLSAMVLDRKGSVNPEDKKYLDWILEKAVETDELIDLIRRSR